MVAVADKVREYSPDDLTDTDVNAAIESADVIILSLFTTAREEYFAAIATHAHTGTLVFNPTRMGTAPAPCRNDARSRPRAQRSTHLRTGHLPVHRKGPRRQPRVASWAQERIQVAAVVTRCTAEAVALLKPLYSEIVAARSVFHTCLDSSSSSLHLATVIFNMAHIENRGAQPCDNYDVSAWAR